MKESFQQAEDFLNAIFKSARFELHAKAGETADGCVLSIEGRDAPLLRAEGGELLDALEHVVNQAFSRSLGHGERLVCDVEGFRAMREAELRAMARHAAERVRSSNLPFTFGPMNPSERRVIHLALAREEDLHTESVGEGNARRLMVSPKSSSKH